MFDYRSTYCFNPIFKTMAVIPYKASAILQRVSQFMKIIIFKTEEAK